MNENDEIRYRVPFHQVPDELINDERTDSYHIAVFCALAMHANKDLRCWPSVSRISALIRASRTKVKYAIADLVEMGWISVSRRIEPETGVQSSNIYHLSQSLQGGSPGDRGVGHQVTGGRSPGDPEPYSLNQIKGKARKTELHPTLGVPINRTRYDGLCSKYDTKVVDDYIERVALWAGSKVPQKRIGDYAAAAGLWMKKDGVGGKVGSGVVSVAAPTKCPVCGGRVRSTNDEALCDDCEATWELRSGSWVMIGESA